MDGLSEQEKSRYDEEMWDSIRKRKASNPNGHVHREAYMMMAYQCNECEGIVHVWNSRDGVTPFGLRCRSGDCTGDMYNQMNLMRYAPLNTVEGGDLVWIDTTPELRRARSIKIYMTADSEFALNVSLEKFVTDAQENAQVGEPYLIQIPA